MNQTPRPAPPQARKPAFYGVVVSNRQTSERKGPALRWSPRFDTAAAAARWGRALLRAGSATLAFVVKAEGDEKEVLLGFTKPERAKDIIRHWEELWDAIEPADAGGEES